MTTFMNQEVIAPYNSRRDYRGVDASAYDLTVMIPHLETPDELMMILDLWDEQVAVKPLLMVVDTGSTDETCKVLEERRTLNCEVHYIRAHGWAHASAPVAAACDLAFALCRTDRLVLTHTDVFPQRRDLGAELVERCHAEQPVVGYRMSPRDWAGPRWKDMVGHTLTAVWMPTMRRIGATWSMQRGAENYDLPLASGYAGWPDTETTFNEVIRRAGVIREYLGDEPNDVYRDERIVHCRTLGAKRIYSPSEYEVRMIDVDEEMDASAERLLTWHAEDADAPMKAGSVCV